MVGMIESPFEKPKMANLGNKMSVLGIVKRLKAPLSEEQAWAIIYESSSALITIREENETSNHEIFVDIKFNTVEILKDGTINFTEIIECSTNQEEEDLLYSLGRFVFECLDYGMESSMERQLDPELEHLISDMTRVDEGMGDFDELEESLRYQNGLSLKRERGQLKNESQTRNVSLENVVNRCIQHLPYLYHVGHFRAVCRALVNEALELTAFLQQLYNGTALLSQSWGQGLGSTNWVLLQNLQEAQWAQLWLQVMRELRRGVTLKHVSCQKLPPLSYELTPYEMLLNDIRYKRYNLSPVCITAEVKKDAHDVILEFIRSRPPLSKSSERKMNPPPPKLSTPHDRLLREIKRGTKLHSVPWPVQKGVREIYLEEKLGIVDTEEFLQPKRKCLNPPTRLSVLIDHWDTISTDQSIDLDSSDSSRPETPRFSLFEQELVDETDSPRRKIQRASTPKKPNICTSLFDESCIKNENFAIVLGGMLPKVTRPVFPPSLRSLEDIEITSKIAMTLEEVKHVRRTLAKLELESLDPNDRLYKCLSKGRLCFCCRGRKFSLFGSWSRVCEICQSKVCQSCLLEVDSRSSYVFQDDDEANRRDSGIGDMYWPFAYLNLGVAIMEPGKTHRMCVSCKRFIKSHC